MSAAEEEELLRKILQSPSGDASREKLGALLDARGDPRGEFIRIQLQLHEGRYLQKFPPNFSALSRRQTELLEEHGDAWARDVAPLVDGCRSYRGFVDHVTLDAAAFLERAEAIYAVAPVIYLSLKGVRDVHAELFASPHLARIRALDIGDNHLEDGHLEALAASPHLGKLVWLELSFNQISARGVEALAASRTLPDLSYVKLTSNRVEDPADYMREIDMYSPDLPILDWGSTQLGFELEEKYGPLRWLHYRSSSDFFRLPDFDGVLPP